MIIYTIYINLSLSLSFIMKCIILGIVVLIRLSLMKVGEEMGLDEGESYIVKDKVMRLRKRNKKCNLY